MKRWQAIVLRVLIIIVAGFFFSDYFPTHVDGAGPKLAWALLAVAGAIPAGDKTPDSVKDLAEDIEAAKKETP